MPNQTNQTEIPVIFSIDDHFVPYLSVCLTSLIAQTSPETHYHVFVLNQSLTTANQAALRKLTTENVTIDLMTIDDDLIADLSGVDGTLRGDQFTLTIFFRLFIADLFSQYDKVIYLDADTILRTDITSLYQIELGNNLLAGAIDTFAQEAPSTIAYVNHMLGIPQNHYINSGVLLMNLKQLRTEHFSTHFLNLMNTYHFDVLAPDQDYLNAMCHDRILLLDRAWNAMPSILFTPVDDPKIVHYAVFNKPWHYNDVQYQDYFWAMAAQTPYLAELQQTRAAYTPEQLQHDQLACAGLRQRAQQLTEQPTTFASTQEAIQ
jgi:lipopolysaccharide biosynthesis glycosyltransferase